MLQLLLSGFMLWEKISLEKNRTTWSHTSRREQKELMFYSKQKQNKIVSDAVVTHAETDA